jgi:hypothetical protein
MCRLRFEETKKSRLVIQLGHFESGASRKGEKEIPSSGNVGFVASGVQLLDEKHHKSWITIMESPTHVVQEITRSIQLAGTNV